jgi:RimJ/RimL family protein N-acetyltransferase
MRIDIFPVGRSTESEKSFFVNGDPPSNPTGELLEEGYAWEIWKPSFAKIVPKGMPLLPFGAWWILHYAKFFFNREYALFLIRHTGTIVHRSVVTPGYFRFPFMGKEDLQIGDTWTSADHRGKGLAVFAIRKIVAEYARQGERIWYVTDKNNLPSIKAAERAGLVRYGEGRRTKRFGIGLFGQYEIVTRL